jgi:hypothetical protein
MDDKRRYVYKPSPVAAFFLIGLFAGGTAMFYSETQGDDGLILEQIITLSPDQAKPVFWLLTIAGAILSIYFVLGFYRILTRKGELVIDGTALTVPPSPFSSKYRVVPFADIVALSLWKVKRRRLLRLQLPQGHLDLNIGHFKDPKTYEDFERDLRSACHPFSKIGHH